MPARQEREHVSELEAAIQARNGLLPGPDEGPVGARRLTAAIEVEQRVLAALLHALARVRDRDLRLLLGAMFATDAEHLAFIRGLAGDPPVPHAFVMGVA